MIMKQVNQYIPDHYHYVDPFVGTGASLLARRTPSKLETINDLDRNIYTFFKVVSSDTHFADLNMKIRRLPYMCQGLVEDAVDALRSDDLTPVDRALAWLILTFGTRHQQHPLAHTKPNISILRKTNSNPTTWQNLPYRIEMLYERFKRVQVLHKDWRFMLEYFDGKGTFFFIDPPYLPSVRHKKLYKHEMSHQDHVELLENATALKAKVMLWGYDSDLYNESLKDWHKLEFEGLNSNHDKRVDVAWVNYKV